MTGISEQLPIGVDLGEYMGILAEQLGLVAHEIRKLLSKLREELLGSIDELLGAILEADERLVEDGPRRPQWNPTTSPRYLPPVSDKRESNPARARFFTCAGGQ
ncbi:MAG: hypothetical protein PHS57_06105 [Alphaproteobacteria bacterium]|nr:hypothetical protein [Alphaproteobacteria bacterium]